MDTSHRTIKTIAIIQSNLIVFCLLSSYTLYSIPDSEETMISSHLIGCHFPYSVTSPIVLKRTGNILLVFNMQMIWSLRA